MATQYDHNLLAEAQRPTRAQLQEGYDPNLLSNETGPSSANGHGVAKENFVGTASPRSIPWWRTTKGIVGIAVVAVVVLVAVIVGAVEGSKKHSTNASAGEIITGSLSAASVSSSAGLAQFSQIIANITSVQANGPQTAPTDSASPPSQS